MKKSHFLQTLYLQKPLFLILLIATLSTLPWIGLGDFYTKGEPREAALAVSMIEKGEWVIPSSYADEFAYKPPLNHWLIAGFSLALTHGEVTPFTSRLPSAIAFIAMIGVCFMFFVSSQTCYRGFRFVSYSDYLFRNTQGCHDYSGRYGTYISPRGSDYSNVCLVSKAAGVSAYFHLAAS
jgi:4-amino-4-deoxy-L-arabinose transferase and related glycosyltransferases of PMT family